MVGAVASRFTVTGTVRDPPRLTAVHETVVVPSVDTVVAGVHPVWLVTGVSGSLTVNETLTVPVYHPFVPCVPVTFDVMSGGLLSTNTVNVFGADDRPAASAAVQVTVVWPAGNVLPE